MVTEFEVPGPTRGRCVRSLGVSRRGRIDVQIGDEMRHEWQRCVTAAQWESVIGALGHSGLLGSCVGRGAEYLLPPPRGESLRQRRWEPVGRSLRIVEFNALQIQNSHIVVNTQIMMNF